MTGTINQMAGQAKAEELLRRAARDRRSRGRTPCRGPAAALAVAAMCVVATLAGPAQAATSSFDAPKGYDIAGGAAAVAVGDFDGDDHADLAAAYGQGQGAISVWAGTGAAADPFRHRTTDVAVGVRPLAMTAADFDGDGRDDLAVANAGAQGAAADDDVSILMGSASGLVAGQVVPVRDLPLRIDAGDLDQDGDTDLAVANFGSSEVSVLTGDGRGHFGAGHVDVACSPAGVAIGDFVDAGGANLGVACPTVVRVFARDAAGTWAQSGADLQACGALLDLASGNFETDPHDDLAVGCDSDRFAVLVSEMGFGAYSFRVPTPSAGASLIGVEAADVNSDGYDDVVATDNANSQAIVADGNGGGRFFPEAEIMGVQRIGSQVSFGTSTSLSQVIPADVDDDGKLDLVAAAGTGIAVSRNTTPVPGLRTGSVSSAGARTATVGGIVNPSGTANANNTTYRFEYGTSAAYGSTTAALPSGASLAGNSYIPVSAALDGLSPATEYHYRLVASNGNGTTYGRDRTFRTAAAPPASTTPDARKPDAGGPADRTAPRVSRLRTARGRISYRLSEAARVRIRVDRVRKGRSRTKVRALTRSAGAGRNAISFRRPLARGRYRVSLVAIDAAGNRTGVSRRVTVR